MVDPLADAVAFFDIGNTLAVVSLSPSGGGIELAVFPEVPQRAGAPAPRLRLLFVGEDAGERAQAQLAGFLVAERPGLALAVLGQQAAPS